MRGFHYGQSPLTCVTLIPMTKPATGIFGTDVTKPLSTLIEEARTALVKARNVVDDSISAYGWKDRLQNVEGLMTCGLVYLAHIREEVVQMEVMRADSERGPSLRFNSRGIGLDSCPACFVCGTKERAPGSSRYLHNIAAFVASKEEGEQIARWFALPGIDCARVDFRPSEPNWIQVKIGVCDAHLPALQWLDKRVTENHGRLREQDVKDARLGSLPH